MLSALISLGMSYFIFSFMSLFIIYSIIALKINTFRYFIYFHFIHIYRRFFLITIKNAYNICKLMFTYQSL